MLISTRGSGLFWIPSLVASLHQYYTQTSWILKDSSSEKLAWWFSVRNWRTWSNFSFLSLRRQLGQSPEPLQLWVQSASGGSFDPKEMDVDWMMMFDEPIWLVGCHHLIVPPQKREMFKHDCNMTVFLTAKKHFLKKNFSQTYTLAVAFFCLFCHN